MVVVDRWEEVTEESVERWWAKLSPLLEDARWMVLAEFWSAFVRHPCPGTIQEFVASIRAGKCPPHADPRTCPTNSPPKANYPCLFENNAWCPGRRRKTVGSPSGWWPKS